jgi:hypothetical protein
LPGKIEVEGVGVVEVDDSFFNASPEVQQATLAEIKASSGGAPSPAPAPAPQAPPKSAAPQAPKAPPASYDGPETFSQMEAALNDLYPGKVHVNSRKRTPEHNAKVGGVPGSHHISGHSLDIHPIPGVPIERVVGDLRSRGFDITEKLHHKNHYHLTAAGYTPPEGTPETKLNENEAAASAEAQTAFANGASRADMEALQERYGVRFDNLDAAFKYRDVDGGKETVMFTATTREPVADPDNPAGTAPPEAQGQDGDGLRAPGVVMQGVNRGIASTLGAPVDLTTAAINTVLPDDYDIKKPLLGSESIEHLLGLAGALRPEMEPQTRGEEYLAAAGEGIGGSVIPGLGLVGRGKAVLAGGNTLRGGATKRALDKLASEAAKRPGLTVATELSAGAGSGIGAEAAEDIAPDSSTARALGQLAGGVAGGAVPLARPALRAAADARFVSKQSRDNPFAAFDAEIAQDLGTLVDGTARAPTDPKGRAAVTIKAVNNLESRYLIGFRERLSQLDLPQAEKRRLKDAIEGKHSLTQSEVDALRGTVPGDAVADAIVKTQRLRALTPEIKRGGVSGALKSAAEALSTVAAGITGGPVAAPAGYGAVRYFLSRGADAEAARVHSAERILARKRAYEKLQGKVGPSGQRESQAAFNELYDETVTSREQADAAAAAEREAVQARKEQAKAEKEERRRAKGGATDREYLKEVLRPTVSAPDPRDALSGRAAAAGKALKKLESETTRAARSFENEMSARDKAAQPRPAKGSAVDQSYEQAMAQGLTGESNTQASIAERLGVPVPDMLRALDAVAPQFPDAASDIKRIRMNFPTKNRGLFPALGPAMRKVLEADGTMSRVAAKPATTPKAGGVTQGVLEAEMAKLGAKPAQAPLREASPEA